MQSNIQKAGYEVILTSSETETGIEALSPQSIIKFPFLLANQEWGNLPC